MASVGKPFHKIDHHVTQPVMHDEHVQAGMCIISCTFGGLKLL